MILHDLSLNNFVIFHFRVRCHIVFIEDKNFTATQIPKRKYEICSRDRERLHENGCQW